MQSVLRIIKAGGECIKKNWRDILAVITVAGLVGVYLNIRSLQLQRRELEVATKEFEVATKAFDIAREQLEYEQSLQPKLEYSYQVVPLETEQQVILDAAKQLIETFYEKVYEYTQTNVAATYLEAVDAILPLTTTIHARPTEIRVWIENNSDNESATATKVRLFLTMDRPVTSYNVGSQEPFSLVEGGIGEHQIAIEVDRIVAGDSISVTVASESIELETQLDQMVMKKRLQWPPIIWEPRDWKTALVMTADEFMETRAFWFSPEDLEVVSFPGITYIPAQEPDVRIEITSDQGPATFKRR